VLVEIGIAIAIQIGLIGATFEKDPDPDPDPDFDFDFDWAPCWPVNDLQTGQVSPVHLPHRSGLLATAGDRHRSRRA